MAMDGRMHLAMIIEEAIDSLPARDRNIPADQLESIIDAARGTGIIDPEVLRSALIAR